MANIVIKQTDPQETDTPDLNSDSFSTLELHGCPDPKLKALKQVPVPRSKILEAKIDVEKVGGMLSDLPERYREDFDIAVVSEGPEFLKIGEGKY